MQKEFFVYILTNKNNSVLYVGVTSNIKQRINQHKTGFYPNSFSKRYNINKLVYFEFQPTSMDAINREKQLKGGNRQKKIDLINTMNPEWKDLSEIW
jgi:putative endonuclease